MKRPRKRIVTVAIKVTPEEKAMIEQAAKASYRSVSSFLYMLISEWLKNAKNP